MDSSPSDCRGSSITYSKHLNTALSISFATFVILTLVILLLKSIFGYFIHRSPSNTAASNQQADHVAAASDDAVTGPRHTSCSVDHLESVIPVTNYVSSQTGGDFDENCSICLAEFSQGDTVRVLPKCKHIFHKDCIDQWMPNRSSFCPVCRDRAIERDAEPPRTNCTNNGLPPATVILNFGTSTGHIPAFL